MIMATKFRPSCCGQVTVDKKGRLSPASPTDSQMLAVSERHPKILNRPSVPRFFPSCAGAPLQRSRTKHDCDTLQRLRGGCSLRLPLLTSLDKSAQGRGYPQTDHQIMLAPDQWDSVLGSVTGTIYRGTENLGHADTPMVERH